MGTPPPGEEDDLCPGHLTVTGGLVSCGLPYGHRGVPSEPYDLEKDGGIQGHGIQGSGIRSSDTVSGNTFEREAESDG